MQDVKRLFDNSVSVGLACVVALLLLTSGLSYWNTRQLVRDAKWVAHSYEVQSATSAVLLAMVDAETGQRGFLITGQDKFLEPYDSALARLEDQVAQLKDLTVDNQEQQARVSQLEELIQSRLESMQHGLALRRQNAEEATLWVASGAGKSKMDALRDLVSTIQTTENNLLQARQSQSRQTYRLAVISGLTAAAMALITLGAFSWLLHRSLLVRQEAADILHEQREGFRLTLACIGDGLITTDVEGRVTSLNPVAEALTGWTTSEAHGQPLTTVFQIVNEETRAPVINPVFKALQEGVVVGLANHTVLISKDGTERPIDDSAAPIRGLDLVVKGCVLVFRDVTERQRTEAALGRSEQGLRFHSQILAQVNDVVGAIDNDQKILYLNAAGERLYGVKASEVVGHPLSDLYERRWPSPEYEAEALATLKETGQAQWEVIHATPDGRELQVESKIAVFRDNDGQPLGLIAAVRDVTAQKLATEELRANQHFLERVTDITPGVIHVFDLEKQLSVYVNRSVATVLGYSPQDIEDLGTQVVQALMHPDDLPRFEVHQQSLRRLPDHETLTFEYRVLDQSGQWHWFHSRDTVFARNAKGEVSRYIGMALDITEQKRIEEQLQQSERSFRAIFEQSAVGKAQISAATGRYVRVNQKFCSLTGYSEAELKERTPADITWEADRNLTETGYSKLFQGETSLFELEKRFLRKDGKVAWALVNSTLMRDAESRPDRTITVIQDIHARKQAELELQESQQQFHTLVDAMPQLAWIAHPDGYIYWYNQRWYTYTGTTPESPRPPGTCRRCAAR